MCFVSSPSLRTSSFKAAQPITALPSRPSVLGQRRSATPKACPTGGFGRRLHKLQQGYRVARPSRASPRSYSVSALSQKVGSQHGSRCYFHIDVSLPITVEQCCLRRSAARTAGRDGHCGSHGSKMSRSWRRCCDDYDRELAWVRLAPPGETWRGWCPTNMSSNPQMGLIDGACVPMGCFDFGNSNG